MARWYLLIVAAALYYLLNTNISTVSAQEFSRIRMIRLLPSPLYFAPISEDINTLKAVRFEAFPKTPKRSLRPVWLETEFQTEMPEPYQTLLQRKEPRVVWRLTAISLSSDTLLTSEGAFASGPPDSLNGTRPMTDWHHRIRLVHARPWEKVRYGIEYQYDGNAKDRGQMQLWSEWEFGDAKLKTSIAKLDDNIGKSADRPRLATLKSEIAMDLAVLTDTRFGLSYTRAFTRSTWEPEWSDPSKHSRDTVGISLAYQRSVWEAMFTSTYASAQNRLARQQEAITLRHELSLGYRLARELTITPSMHYTQEWTQPSQVWTTTPSVGLAVTHHQLLKDVDVTAKSSYAWSQNPHRTVETRKINATGSLVWHVKQFRLGTAMVSLEMSYVNVRDRTLPINSYEGLTGGLSLRIRFS